MTIITILIFILVLTVLVLIHELGHFVVAKFFKIKVEEFGFGLPPRIVGKKFGETLYSLNWLPIGGFVKLYGEDEAGGGRISGLKSQITNLKDKDRTFYGRAWWQRALVIVAGVVMNFLLTFVVISFLFGVVGVSVPGNKVYVDNVLKGSPADTAGLKKGDIIEDLNGVKIISTIQLIETTKTNLGHKMNLRVLSDGRQENLEITPRVNYPKDQGPMGIVISQNIELKKYPWYQAPIEGFKMTIDQTIMLVLAGGALIGQIFSTGQIPSYSVAGPVGVAQLTGQVAKTSGAVGVLSLLGLLSLNLGIINILPIPALDGGRLFFILIEGITRRKVHPKLENYAHTIGMILLLALIALITLHDLARVISGQPILPKQ